MENHEVNQQSRLYLRRLAVPIGLALLFIMVLLWGFIGVTSVSADPGTLYVDGSTGSDAGNCQTSASPCATIGYAASQAVSNDSVLVTGGTYNENLEFTGITLTVRGGYTISGTQWISNTGETIIDGNNAGRTIFVHDDSHVVLGHLTITGGNAPEDQCWGGGVQVTNGEVTIRNAVITGNQALCTSGLSGGGAGGGVNAVFDEGPVKMTIEDSIISDNVVGDHGGAAASDHATIHMSNVLVTGNSATSGAANAFAFGTSDVTVVNSTISDNNPQGAQGVIISSSTARSVITTPRALKA